MPPVGFEPTISAGERPTAYRLWCVVVCDLETSRMGAPYIYDISNLRVKDPKLDNLPPGSREMERVGSEGQNFQLKEVERLEQEGETEPGTLL